MATLHTDISQPQSGEREQRTQEGLLGPRGWALGPRTRTRNRGDLGGRSGYEYDKPR